MEAARLQRLRRLQRVPRAFDVRGLLRCLRCIDVVDGGKMEEVIDPAGKGVRRVGGQAQPGPGDVAGHGMEPVRLEGETRPERLEAVLAAGPHQHVHLPAPRQQPLRQEPADEARGSGQKIVHAHTP